MLHPKDVVVVVVVFVCLFCFVFVFFFFFANCVTELGFKKDEKYS